MSSPLPFDLSAIAVPLPDPAHEVMRQTVLALIGEVWAQHLQLVDRVSALEAQVFPNAAVSATGTGSATIT